MLIDGLFKSIGRRKVIDKYTPRKDLDLVPANLIFNRFKIFSTLQLMDLLGSDCLNIVSN
jgi:hypothetical protein